ncbi:hypothetical protein GCM10009676_42230 [Prauserella halophila]|uniref:ESAT-6 protein secretion system EspG family protein n=1 Tax=Prauserella halophila TaxID=185641 RepID=A0ABN1WHZ0_9PSEU|nr:ESX secretion-associated protein EspG [Prauserella halophila]MCP2236622.1 EspG family protein [Prauserella halophila]
MAVINRPVALPRLVLARLWELEGLGSAHPVLGVSEMYTPRDDRAEVDAGIFRGLEEVGIANGEMLTREFRVALRILASPERELYCWSSHGDDPSRSRALAMSTAGGQAVAVQVHDDMVTIAHVDERRLVEEFVGELPQVPAAPVRELHTSRAAYEQRDERRDMFAARPGPEQELHKHMNAPREAAHQVYTGATVDGRYRRSKPFSLVDIRGSGRILVFADGQQNIHLLPGSPANLARTFAATWQAM